MSNDWNIGKKNSSGLLTENERAIVIGLITGMEDEKIINDYLNELEFLASTAGAITIQRFTQKADRPDKRYYIGSGKVEEIRQYIEDNDIDLVIFDDDLSPSQSQNLEKVLKRKILDRSNLILDIFASHARTAQAKTQVELAQMQYLLPRLRGLWTHLERQKGGIGMRGPGEKEIETDRRIVRDKISKLKDKLAKIELQNETQRKNRGEFIRVALVGYTNVGKSTIMNRLSKSEVLAENKLFATLDTTVRKVVFGRMPFLMSDTVGFIRKLPHHLVESFKSTLDEARESDILLHVIDISHPKYEEHIATVIDTLRTLGVDQKPVLMIFNKLDLYRNQSFDELLSPEEKKNIEEEFKESLQKQYQTPMVFVSAHTNEHIDDLRNTLQHMIEQEYDKRYPYKTKYW
ncbi:GTPase HflX [Membranihabitans marinus]|uniref:GTPase HflX n=1 Tax=Membranihabitans marinus TaxID=1227546 RepID=UPI001F007B08|nr:GTPase HflX [Membranihabitans marinus]